MNNSVAKAKQNTMQEPTISRSLVRTDHATSSLRLISAEQNKIGAQQSTDTESGKSKHSQFMRPKNSSDARSLSHFVDLFQLIGESKIDKNQLTIGRNTFSRENDDWYKIINYKSPLNFTIENKSIEHEKEIFQEHLNKLAPSWTFEKNPNKDTVYAALHGGQWVRAILGDNLDTNSNVKWFRMVDDSGCFKLSTNK